MKVEVTVPGFPCVWVRAPVRVCVCVCMCVCVGVCRCSDTDIFFGYFFVSGLWWCCWLTQCCLLFHPCGPTNFVHAGMINTITVAAYFVAGDSLCRRSSAHIVSAGHILSP